MNQPPARLSVLDCPAPTQVASAGQRRSHNHAMTQIELHEPNDASLLVRVASKLQPPKSGVSVDFIKSYLDTLIVISSLLFAFSTSYFTAFDRDDLTTSDTDWIDWCSNATVKSPQPHRK